MTARLIHRAHVGRRHASPVLETQQDRTAFRTVLAGLVWCLVSFAVLAGPSLVGPVLYAMGV